MLYISGFVGIDSLLLLLLILFHYSIDHYLIINILFRFGSLYYCYYIDINLCTIHIATIVPGRPFVHSGMILFRFVPLILGVMNNCPYWYWLYLFMVCHLYSIGIIVPFMILLILMIIIPL